MLCRTGLCPTPFLVLLMSAGEEKDLDRGRAVEMNDDAGVCEFESKEEEKNVANNLFMMMMRTTHELGFVRQERNFPRTSESLGS